MRAAGWRKSQLDEFVLETQLLVGIGRRTDLSARTPKRFLKRQALCLIRQNGLNEPLSSFPSIVAILGKHQCVVAVLNHLGFTGHDTVLMRRRGILVRVNESCGWGNAARLSYSSC